MRILLGIIFLYFAIGGLYGMFTLYCAHRVGLMSDLEEFCPLWETCIIIILTWPICIIEAIRA